MEDLKERILKLLEEKKTLIVSEAIRLLGLNDTRSNRDKIRSIFLELAEEYNNIKLIKKQNTYILKLLYRKNLKIDEIKTIEEAEEFKHIAKHIISIITLTNELIEYYIYKSHIIEYIYKVLYNEDLEPEGYEPIKVNIYEIIDKKQALNNIIEAIKNKTNYYIKRINKDLIKCIEPHKEDNLIAEIIKELNGD